MRKNKDEKYIYILLLHQTEQHCKFAGTVGKKKKKKKLIREMGSSL